MCNTLLYFVASARMKAAECCYDKRRAGLLSFFPCARHMNVCRQREKGDLHAEANDLHDQVQSLENGLHQGSCMVVRHVSIGDVQRCRVALIALLSCTLKPRTSRNMGKHKINLSCSICIEPITFARAFSM